MNTNSILSTSNLLHLTHQGHREGDSNLQLISRRTQDDLAEATTEFLSNLDNPRLGHLFATLVDEAKTTKLSRRSLHRGFGLLGAQFTDTEEGIIYECLDYKGDGIAIEDIIVYCMHVTREGYVTRVIILNITTTIIIVSFILSYLLLTYLCHNHS